MPTIDTAPDWTTAPFFMGEDWEAMKNGTAKPPPSGDWDYNAWKRAGGIDTPTELAASTTPVLSGVTGSFGIPIVRTTPTVAAATTGSVAGNGTLPGATATGYDPRYGGVPQSPDPSTSALDAILAAIKNLGNLSTLAGGAGSASATGARNQVLASMPMFDSLMGQFQKNIDSGSKGVIDPDVQALLNQKGAEYGVATGSPGGPAAGAAQLRAMGLTSYALKDQALRNMATLTGLVPRGPEFNPSSMMVDPSQQLMWQWLANQLKSAPIPAAARADELNRQNAGFIAGRRDTGGGAMGGSDFNNFLNSLLNRRGQSDPIVYPSSTGGGGNYYTPRPPAAGTTGSMTTSSRTEDDIINEWLDYVDPVAAGLITSGDNTQYYDPWFDLTADVPNEDWWFDPSYNNYGNEVGVVDDSWFDPGYSNDEFTSEDWWFE